MTNYRTFRSIHETLLFHLELVDASIHPLYKSNQISVFAGAGSVELQFWKNKTWIIKTQSNINHQ